MNKEFNVRILNRVDEYQNWIMNDPVLLKGEICIATIPDTTGVVADEPAVVIKVGDGAKKYSELPFVSAMAADVYEWAKAAQKPTYSADEVTGIDAYIAEYVEEQMGISVDTDTQYQIIKVDEYNYKMQSKGKTDQAWADVADIAIPNNTYNDSEIRSAITALQTAVGDTSVAEQIVTAIDTLKGKVVNTVAAGNAVEIGGTATAPTIGVKVSKAAENALTVAEDGLMVEVPDGVDYTVTVTESTPEGYAKAYKIAQASTGLNAVINIPKDMVVSSGSVVENPEGQPAGTYIELVLANAESDKIYVNVSDLIEYVTSGSAADDQVVVTVSADHKISAALSESVKDSLGKADTAVQSIATGATNGSIAVDGVDVQVAGLGSAAYTDSSAYDVAGAATTAEENAKAYADALIAGLDVADAAVEKQFVTSVSETDGKISVTRASVADVAMTGSFADLILNAGDTIIFNCGNSTDTTVSPAQVDENEQI